jgi:hypothetical protein
MSGAEIVLILQVKSQLTKRDNEVHERIKDPVLSSNKFEIY